MKDPDLEVEKPRSIGISRFSAWAPGLTDGEQWRKWAKSGESAPCSPESPALEYTPPLFRRRLSQISRMTIQVIHDILPFDEGTKLFFISFRGEIAQQLKINRGLVAESAIMPAAFSMSVFNTPPALAAIALHIESGYSCLYPAWNDFRRALLTAASPILAGGAKQVLVVYADECIPEEYRALIPRDSPPPPSLAFSLLLESPKPGDFRLDEETLESPEFFLRSLYLQDKFI